MLEAGNEKCKALYTTSAGAILAVAFGAVPNSDAAAQSSPDLAQVYTIVKALQERVDTLEAQNRKAQRETADARVTAQRAQAEADALRRRLGSSTPVPAGAPAGVVAAPARAGVVTKEPQVAAPRETVVTAVSAPLPNYYTVGVTPFATLRPDSPTVPAVTPIRVLPTARPELDSLTNGLRLGDNLVFQPYGAITATYSHDSSSPYGLPSPIPGFSGNINGPTAFPASHLNARDSIFGATAMWRDIWRGLSVTGKVEMDLDGNFNGGAGQVGLNSIQSLGSYSPRLRLAYARADVPVTSSTDLFLLAGQDWTPFASSTQPHLLDTANLGAGFGNLWARLPQARAGVSQELGTPFNMRLQLEGALVQPGWGNTPFATAGSPAGYPVVSSGLLAFGERQGADADTPEVQGRAVLQFQLDPAEGVAPAQLIASGMYGRRTVDVLASAIPAAYTAAFPSGAQLNSSRYGWTLEAQLPTRFITVSGKYYEGTGLRFFGAGQFFGAFNDLTGLTGTATAQSVDASNTLVFGMRGGNPVLADQVEPHSHGGFVSVGLPFSRWAGADPRGFNAGWTGYVTYGVDRVRSQDVLKLGGGRESGDVTAASLEYRPIPNLIFGVELSRYQTHAVPLTATGVCPSFKGANTCDWADNRALGSVTFAY